MSNKKKEEKKKENIKIKASHLELLNTKDIVNLLSLPMPPKTSYSLSRIVAKMKEELVIYAKSQDNLLAEYVDKEATLNELTEEQRASGLVSVTAKQEYLDKRVSIMDHVIDIGLEKIDIDIKQMPKISPQQWEFLYPLIN
jgi:hypothetical protein